MDNADLEWWYRGVGVENGPRDGKPPGGLNREGNIYIKGM